MESEGRFLAQLLLSLGTMSKAISFGGVALCAALSLPVVAASAKQPTPANRINVAKQKVRASVKPWVRKGDRLSVRAAIVGFGGNPNNPITGEGPVTVYVRQSSVKPAGRSEKVRRKFDRFANRKFTVEVDRDGNAEILAQESLAVQSRLADKLVPAKNIALELAQSNRAKEAVALGGLGLVAAAVSPEAAVLAQYRAVLLVQAAMVDRNAARSKAFDATVTWAQTRGKSKQGYPTLIGTYRHYKQALREIHDRTRPVEVGVFAEQLAALGL